MDTKLRVGVHRRVDAGTVSWLVAAGAAGAAVWLLLSGCAGAPTRTERFLFDVKTNQVEHVSATTNVVAIDDVAGITTEVAQVTGFSPVLLPVEPVPGHPVRFVTNVTYRTNTLDAYDYTPSARAAGVVATAGGAVGLLGPAGELGALLLAGALGVWARYRTARSAKLAAVLAQVIETGRAVLQSTPQGQVLDERWKAWMITHQAEERVIEDVTQLVGQAVDNASAREAADKLLGLMREKRAES